MNETLRCALIGYGYWGHILHKYLAQDVHIDLVYIYDPNISNGISLETILKDENIEAAFICTPITSHYDIVKTFLKHNKHVFCEKPLTKSLKETTELVNLARVRNLCLYTDYIYTVSPSINYIKEHMNEIGSILAIEGEIQQFGNFYHSDSVEEVLGVHLISAIIYLLGEVKNINVERYFLTRADESNSLESQFELNSPNVSKILLKCSLVSDVKSRKIKITGTNGNFIFDMLGKETVKEFMIKKDVIGYNVLHDHGRAFDESNNLSYAVKNFYNEVVRGGDGNIKLTLAVMDVMEKLKSKRLIT